MKRSCSEESDTGVWGLNRVRVNHQPDPVASAVAASEPFADLERSWPTFLGDLDQEPRLARAAFLELGYRFLVARPPRACRWLPALEPHDVALEVLFSLAADDFRRLRSYRDRGQPFVYWLARVADRKAQDMAKRIKKGETIAQKGEVYENAVETVAGAAVETDPLLRERVHAALASFQGSLCHCLLVWRLVRGYSNLEIAMLLRWPQDRNADVGNRYARCRRALIARLAEAGITERDLLSS
jgi:hypothetical protein